MSGERQCEQRSLQYDLGYIDGYAAGMRHCISQMGEESLRSLRAGDRDGSLLLRQTMAAVSMTVDMRPPQPEADA